MLPLGTRIVGQVTGTPAALGVPTGVGDGVRGGLASSPLPEGLLPADTTAWIIPQAQ